METVFTGKEERLLIRTKVYAQLGTAVSCGGKEMTVTEFEMKFKDGFEEFCYTLVKREPEENEPVQSPVLLGKAEVTDREDPDSLGRIRVDFLEYEDAFPGEKLWIPYIAEPTEKDNGIVFIPDKGEKVLVICGGDGCYAVGCVRETGLSSEISDTSLRSVYTRGTKFRLSDKDINAEAYGHTFKLDENTLELKKDEITVTAKTDSVEINVKAFGHTLKLTKNIFELKKDDLALTSKSDSTVLKKGSLTVTAKDGELTVKNPSCGISMSGSDLKLTASGKLQGKGSSVNIDANGNVTIKAPAVNIG